MYKNIKYAVLAGALVFTGTACEDLLNVEPAQSVSPEVALSDPGGTRAVYYNVYRDFQITGSNYGRDMFLAPEILADNLTLRPGASRYQTLADNSPGTGVNNYGRYGQINKANIILDAVAPGTLPEAEYNRMRGEMLVVRALGHFDLVRTYGYEPGKTPASGPGAGWTEGVILRTSAVLGLTAADLRERSSVAQVYTQINKDLDDALILLAANGGTNRTYITEGFARGLRAKVYLYQSQWAQAVTAATAAIGATAATMATTEAQVTTLFSAVNGTPNSVNRESIFQVGVASNESPGVNNSMNAYTGQQWCASVPTSELMALYDAVDWRLNWYRAAAGTCNTAPSGFELIKWSGASGNFGDDLPIMRLPELYLIRAEARVRANFATGIAASVADLNVVRTARGLPAMAVVDFPDLASFVAEILDERRREFAGEGQRWYDLKRLGMNIPKSVDRGNPPVPFTDYRLLAPIPQSQTDLNPALVQNPGY